MDKQTNWNEKAERMTPGHLSDVAELEKLCFAEPWSESSLSLLTREGGVAFVVCEEGRAVAYGGMMTVLDEGQITNVAVHPDCRRRGYGRVIAEALVVYAKDNGLVSISLEVRESNEAAISLYRACGFEICGRRRGFYRKPVEDALIMVWNA